VPPGPIWTRLLPSRRSPAPYGAAGTTATGPLLLIPSAIPRWLAGKASVRIAAEFASRHAPPMPCTTRNRRKLLELTAEGRAVLEDDRRRREGWLAEAIETELSAEEREVLARALPLLARLKDL
jgi:hypothetical protein